MTSPINRKGMGTGAKAGLRDPPSNSHLRRTATCPLPRHAAARFAPPAPSLSRGVNHPKREHDGLFASWTPQPLLLLDSFLFFLAFAVVLPEAVLLLEPINRERLTSRTLVHLRKEQPTKILSTLCAGCLLFLFFAETILLFSAITAWQRDQVVSKLNSAPTRDTLKAEVLAKR